MNKHSPMLVAIAAALIFAGCGKDDSSVEKTKGPSFEVVYEVTVNSGGAVKITHKDNQGREVVDDPVVANAVGEPWKKKYTFEDKVDALLKVELPDSAPTDPVGAEMEIAIDGVMVQNTTTIVTKAKGMSLTATRP